MVRRPPISTRTYTLFPYTPLFRSQGLQYVRGIVGRTREDAGLVEAGRERDHAETRHAAVGRLDAGQATQRRWLADRAAGIGRGGDRRQTRGHGGDRTARRAARQDRKSTRLNSSH